MKMKTFTASVALLLLPCQQTVAAQEKDTLSTFIRQNPYAVGYDVIHEGTRLNLAADDDYLFVNLSIAHPTLQMRFLMQQASLCIDPTGKKRKDHEILLPCGLDVKDEVEAVMPRDMRDRGENERPDIRPLIAALNKHGAAYRSGGSSIHLGYQLFHIEHDRQNERLNYYILIPKNELMQTRKLSAKWALGIFSINDFAGMPPPEQGEGMMPPPMAEGDRQDMMELMQSDIREWVKFSIDDVNNANLNE